MFIAHYGGLPGFSSEQFFLLVMLILTGLFLSLSVYVLRRNKPGVFSRHAKPESRVAAINRNSGKWRSR
ncbi:TPA: hypothetical protein DF272_06825 [Candidatus Falkowbacteria bacterium]|nr:hypothetical protein [Candidatus Falkowbacteria bacterium]